MLPEKKGFLFVLGIVGKSFSIILLHGTLLEMVNHRFGLILIVLLNISVTRDFD